MNKLRNLDSFGAPISINCQGDNTMKNAGGALLTLSVYALTLYVAILTAISMTQYKNLSIKNYTVTTSDEKMLETRINLPEYNADIAIGFASKEEKRFIQIPANIGQWKIRMAYMESFDKDVVYTDLKLEPCGQNSLIKSKQLESRMQRIMEEAACVVDADKPKINIQSHFES